MKNLYEINLGLEPEYLKLIDEVLKMFFSLIFFR